MNEHPPDHEDLLRMVAVGEIDVTDPLVSQRREECAQCDDQIARLFDVVQLLEDDADEAAEILALAERLEDVPGERELLAFRPPREGATPTPTDRPRRIRLLGAALAAAAALIFLWILRGDQGDSLERPPRMLGGDEIVLNLQPIGSIAAYAPFRWERNPSVSTTHVRTYTLVIEGEEYFESFPNLIEDQWNDSEQAAAFPKEIEWWVEAYDVTGVLVGSSAPAKAERVP